MKNLFIALAALVAVGCIKTESKPNEQNKAKISDDPVFNEYCQQFDADGDGVLSEYEADAITKISVIGASSLDGIDIFHNLEWLHCGDGGLIALDLSSNKKLWRVELRNNNLSATAIINMIETLPIVETGEVIPGVPDYRAQLGATIDMQDGSGITYDFIREVAESKGWGGLSR